MLIDLPVEIINELRGELSSLMSKHFRPGGSECQCQFCGFYDSSHDDDCFGKRLQTALNTAMTEHDETAQVVES